jgi:creatinine amidohydrolase/Fe(II)-dependent formamide hydrolase-like protein
MGDSGGNQPPLVELAAKLSKEWAQDGVQVISLQDYYDGREALAWAARQQLGGAEPQAHGGFMDTSETMAAKPDGLRREALEAYDPKDSASTGVAGDPSGATAQHGEKLLALRVAAGVAQIRAAMAAQPTK